MTIKEIAKLAGVSIATVSKIVNGKDQNINPETRSKVLQIVKEYHYSPYSTIRENSSAKTFLLGILLKNSSKNNQIVKGILEEAQTHNYGILLFDSHNNPREELKHITALVKAKIDGVIWEPANADSLQYTQLFSKPEIPIAFLNSDFCEHSFHIDYKQMGYALTQKLIAHKHTAIACLIQKNNAISQKIEDGFKKCLFDNQIPYTTNMSLNVEDSNYIHTIFSYNMTGVVCPHYDLALSLYEQLIRLRYTIPSDLSLVSLKNENTKDIIYFPAISGIQIPFTEFGKYVCENLINICEKKEKTSPIFFYKANENLDHESSLSTPAFLHSKKILVVGSIHIDNTFSVETLPQAGKTTKIQNTSISLGGKGANQSIGVAKLGQKVSLIGKIGKDADSAFATTTLENENVTTAGISRDSQAQTGKAFIYLEPDGESAITILPGANNNLIPADILTKEHLFQNVGYTLLSTELPLQTIITAAKTSKKYGAKTILKPATLTSIPTDLFSHIDIIIPNKKEASTLCPSTSSPEEQADFFLAQGIKTVIITLGHKGCFLKTKEKSQYFQAADFAPIDTTGGADAFIAALAAYLTTGYSLEKAIQIASYAAGFCISQQGVVPALASKETLEAYIHRQNNTLL